MAVDSKAPSNLMDLNDTADGKIGLDSELADMKLSDDASGGSKSSSKKATDGKQCWTTKFTLRSHLDSVTSAAFHSNNLSLVTAGEDACIKYWNLEQASSSSSTKKNAHVDLEPVRVYRGHEGRVNTVLLANLIPPSIDSKYQQYLEYGMVLSGGSDCDLHLWSVPGPEDQLYGKCKYKTVALARFSAHQDAIWSMKLHDIRPLLATASADGYVKLWNLNNLTDDHFSKGKIAAGDVVCRSLSFNGEMAYKDGDPIPTSIDFVHSESNLLVAAFNNSQAKVFDVETGKCVRKLEGADQTYNMTPATQINQVIVHKTANTIVTAHEDRFIRFFDCRTGGHVHGMVAHLDSVSCIDISPNGMVLASGGHDGSVRFWDIASKTCLQEFTFHRKKFEESVNSVLFHPRLSPASSSPADSAGTQVCGGSSWFVSCGADSTARVYNCL